MGKMKSTLADHQRAVAHTLDGYPVVKSSGGYRITSFYGCGHLYVSIELAIENLFN